MMDPGIRTTFEACLAAVRNGDAAAFHNAFSGEAEGYSSLAGELKSAAAFRAALMGLNGRMPGVAIAPVRTYGEGPEMAARMRLSAKGRESEGIFAFRFDANCRIARLIALWDPASLLGGPSPRLPKAAEAAVQAYFRTYNDDDEDAHMALISPELVYFGAVSRMTAEGIETARGIFRTAHERMGLKRFEPTRIFHGGPHLAVLARIHGIGAGGPTEEGVWVFRLDDQGRFDRVSVLWNPGTFLTWNHR